MERILTGEITINGLPSKQLYSNPARLHGIIGYMPQNDNIDVDLTVSQHLTHFAKLVGIDEAQIEGHVCHLIGKLCLDDVRNEPAGVLSDGYKRRLSLGMALIGRPKIVILDDPLAGVDHVASKQLLKLIKQETEESTLLVCTPDVEVAQILAQKLAIMHDGRLIAIGSISDFMREHGAGYTVELQVNVPLLESSFVPRLDQDEFGLFIDNEQQAKQLLRRMQTYLDENGAETAMIFEDEFDQGGLLKAQQDEVLAGIELPVDSFMKQVIILNIATSVQRDLMMKYGKGVKINSI